MTGSLILPNALPSRKLTFWHLLILFFGSEIVSAIFCAFVFAVRSPSPFIEHSAVTLSCSIIGLVFYHYMAMTRGWPSLIEWFRFRRPMILLCSFLAPAVISACLVGLGILAVRLFGDLPETAHSDLMPNRSAQLPLAILTAVIVAPAFEELLFRGVFFVWLRARLSLLASILLTSLIFALVHDNHYSDGPISIFFFGQRFGLGVGTALLAQYFRSLAPGYAFHAGWNLIVTLIGAFTADL